MRYSSEHKAETRQRLLKNAATLAKENGFGTTGVDALMATAGLTSGAFYAHFGSKSALLEAMIEHELQQSLTQFQVATPQAFQAAVATYLSHAHVQHPGQGCALPTLTAEVARADQAARETFERLLLQIKDRIATQVHGEDQAWSTLSQIVGAVMLARAIPSRQVSTALLQSVARCIKVSAKSEKS